MDIFPTKNFSLSVVSCGYYFIRDRLTIHRPQRRRMVTQYEIDYFDQGNGYIEIDKTPIYFEENTLNIRKPGQTCFDPRPYHCSYVWFDITTFENPKKKLETYLNPLYEDCFLNQLPSKIALENQEKIGEAIKKIIEYHNHEDQDYGTLMENSYLNLLLAQLYKVYQGLDKKQTKYNAYVNKAIRFIDLNNRFNETTSEEILKVKTIADHIGVSTTYFQNIFKECVGMTPNEYLVQVRIKKAKYLLTHTSASIAIIADQCGFSSNAYFSYAFKKWEGIKPSQYRDEFSHSI